jgi:hypothetical protein
MTNVHDPEHHESVDVTRLLRGWLYPEVGKDQDMPQAGPRPPSLRSASWQSSKPGPT